MEFLAKTAVMMLFAAFLSVRSAVETQLAIVTLVEGADLPKVSSLRIVVPRDKTTGKAVITIDPSELPALRSVRGVSDVSPARRATLELSKGRVDLSSAIQGLGGIVIQRYVNAPLLSVVVPTERFSELKSLSGVIRVRKPKTVTPSRQQ
jgi:hypothetical protein